MRLSQGTLVPIGFIVAAVSVGLAWGSLSNATRTNSEESVRIETRVIRVEDQQIRYNENMERIDRRLSRIEGALDIKVPAHDDPSGSDHK